MKTAGDYFHQLRAGREISIGVAFSGVTDVGGGVRKLLLDVLTFAMPIEQRPHGEAVPEVVRVAWLGTIAGASQPDILVRRARRRDRRNGAAGGEVG